MEALPSKILIVDNDPAIGQSLKTALDRYRVHVDLATSRETAMYLFNQNQYGAIIVEMAFEEIAGLILIQKWRAHESINKSGVGFIVSVGNRNHQEPEEARLISELDGVELISKPFTAVQLLPYLQRALESWQREQKLRELRRVAKTIAKDRSKMDKALQMIKAQFSQLGLKAVGLMKDVYEGHGMWENALSLIEEHLQSNPDHIGLLNSKGKILLRQGRVDEALACMELADDKAPNNIERINNMALAYLMANDPDRAIGKMKQLIDFHPEDKEMKFDLFAQLYDHGFDEHAQALCRDAVKPMEVVRHYNNKGVALAKTGRTEQALEEYSRSLEFYPKFKENYRIHYNIALAHLSFQSREHYEKALEVIGRCLELNPRFEKAIRMKSLIREQLEGKKPFESKAS